MEKQATRDAYGQALVEMGKIHQDIVVLDADLSKSTKTADFAKAFPERFFNAGIAEQNLMGMSAGLATCGKIVYASTFAVFATGRAFEQVRNSLAYGKLNVKVCATHSGITVGEDGGSHQSVEDIALMRSVPNMTVIVPADGVATRKAVSAVYRREGPCYLRLGRPALPIIHSQDADFEIGRGIELMNGPDATLIACGLMVSKCIEAARELEKEGIKLSVIDMHTIKPLDEDLIVRKARETGAIVTAEEHSVLGGLGSAVCECVCANHPVPVLRLGIEDVFGQSGSPDELLDYYGLNVEQVMINVRKILKMKS